MRGIYRTKLHITVLRDEMPFLWNFLVYELTRHRTQEGRCPNACHSDNETCVSCREHMYEDSSCCQNAVFVIPCTTLVLILMFVDECLLLGSQSPEIYTESN